MLCVRTDLPSVLLHATSCNAPEYVVCKVQIGNISLTIASIYIEPLTSVADREVLSILRSLSAPYILCGDFNAHNVLLGERSF